MIATIEALEVAARLKYVRPLPDYFLGVDCELVMRAFVFGTHPIEEELGGLEAFRRSLTRMVREGLSHLDCEKPEEPFVSLTLEEARSTRSRSTSSA